MNCFNTCFLFVVYQGFSTHLTRVTAIIILARSLFLKILYSLSIMPLFPGRTSVSRALSIAVFETEKSKWLEESVNNETTWAACSVPGRPRSSIFCLRGPGVVYALRTLTRGSSISHAMRNTFGTGREGCKASAYNNIFPRVSMSKCEKSWVKLGEQSAF